MTNTGKKGNSARIRGMVLTFFILLMVAAVLIPQLRREAVQDIPEPHYIRDNGRIILPETSPVRSHIRVEEVTIATLSRQVTAPATVEAEPSKRANIFPPAGGRVVRLFASMGQSIASGQALFEMYSPDIAGVQAGYIAARSAVAQAERQLRRREGLHREGIAPLREVEEARTEYEIALSEMEGSLMTMKILGLDETDMGKPLIVKSPVNGRLIELGVAPGEFITETDEPVMIVADLSNVWVTAGLQEKDIRFITAGTDAKAVFPAYPDTVYHGRVLFVSDILDEETRTTKVRIAFDNHDFRLKPGMFASVTFITSPAPALVLPPQAVLQRRDFNYVYVETSPYVFEMRQVVTGSLAGDQISILNGLQVGERVIVQNAVLLP